MTDAGSEFQTSKRTSLEVGARERLDEQWRIVRAVTRQLISWLRYHGTDEFRVFYTNTDTL